MTKQVRIGALIFIVLLAGKTWGAGGSEVPDFRGTAATSRGIQPIGKKDLMGHIWVADFIFTNCGNICPRMTLQMRKLQTRLPTSVKLVSFTIDPDRDTLKNLEGYARNAGADADRWYFIRMKKKPLADLMSGGFKLAKTNKDALTTNAALSHSSRFVVVDASGHIRGSYDGLTPESLDLVSGLVSVLLQEEFKLE